MKERTWSFMNDWCFAATPLLPLCQGQRIGVFLNLWHLMYGRLTDCVCSLHIYLEL
jgi:hypothetical protein